MAINRVLLELRRQRLMRAILNRVKLTPQEAATASKGEKANVLNLKRQLAGLEWELNEKTIEELEQFFAQPELPPVRTFGARPM